MSVRLTLYSRTGCHLCDDLLVALQPLAEELQFGVDVIDIDDNEALVQRFNEQVPVLAYKEEILCFHFLDVDVLRDAVARGRANGEY